MMIFKMVIQFYKSLIGGIGLIPDLLNRIQTAEANSLHRRRYY